MAARPLPRMTQEHAVHIMDGVRADRAAAHDQRLFQAVLDISPKALTAALAAGGRVQAQDSAGSTPLHLAAGRDPTLCSLLLAAGADPLARNRDGDTPLHRAAHHGHVEICRLLHAAGADLQAARPTGDTPLLTAIWEASAGPASEACIHFLLDRGSHVHARGQDGMSALHLAAWRDLPTAAGICRLLLSHGAAVDARDDDQWTPLHLAATTAQDGTCQVLLQHGATVDAQNSTAATPLHVASRTGLQPIAHLFLAAGADPLAADQMGSTADPGLEHTSTFLALPATPTDARVRLRVHALRHLADHPALAARLLAMIELPAG